jgi:hypothetical protein
MSIQKLLNPTPNEEDVFFTLESRCPDSAAWREVDRLVVELVHDSEMHGKHFFKVPSEARHCPSLRIVVQTNSTVPCPPSLSFFSFFCVLSQRRVV